MAPIPSYSTHFYLHPNAVTFGFNALGDYDNLSLSVYANAKVSAYMRDIKDGDSTLADGVTSAQGLGFTPADEYRQWTLSAFPTHFTDEAGVARYCHIAVQRNGGNATLVFPDVRLDVFGRSITDDAQYFLDEKGNPIIPPADSSVEGDSSADPSDADFGEDTPADSGDSAVTIPDPDTSGDYYFFFIAKISASNRGTKPRDWDGVPVFGTLDTARYWEEESKGEWAKMFEFVEAPYEAIRQLVPFLYIMVGKFQKVFTDLFRLDDNDDEFENLDETLPTEAHMRAYGKQQYLSRQNPDRAAAHIDFNQGLTSYNDLTLSDLLPPPDSTVEGGDSADPDAPIDPDAPEADGGASAIPSPSAADSGEENPNTRYLRTLRLGSYNKGMSGGMMNTEGDGELRRLVLREELTVPKLNYNRVIYTNGGTWRAQGGGTIEQVIPDVDANGNELPSGTIILHLEEGEYGALEVGDKCIGQFHFLETEQNADHDSDDHNGNMTMRGFATVYFLIDRAFDQGGSNSEFHYILRSEDERLRSTDPAYAERNGSINRPLYTGMHHPQPQMDFAAYANYHQANRQHATFENNQYVVQLVNMTDWQYGSANIMYVQGYLEGFTIDVITGYDDDRNPIIEQRPLHGHGIGVGNLYKWGHEESLERPKMLVDQQLNYMRTSDAPDVVLARDEDGNYTHAWEDGTRYHWTTDPTSPTPTEPYVYGYWIKHYMVGATMQTEVSDAFLMATYGTMGESSVTVKWDVAMVLIKMWQSDWIEDDEPPQIGQFDDPQQVEINASLIFGNNTPGNIYGIFIDDEDLPPYIQHFRAEPNAEDESWRVSFSVTGFTEKQAVDLPIRVRIAAMGDASILAPIGLCPSFDGADGYNGEDGDDGLPGQAAVVYEIDSNLQSAVYDTTLNDYTADYLTFTYYRITGNALREPFDCYYVTERYNKVGGLIERSAPLYGNKATFRLKGNAAARDTYQFVARMYVDGVEVKSLSVSRVDSNVRGADGDPGKDGENAVVYTLECDVASFVVRGNDYDQIHANVVAYRHDGSRKSKNISAAIVAVQYGANGAVVRSESVGGGQLLDFGIYNAAVAKVEFASFVDARTAENYIGYVTGKYGDRPEPINSLVVPVTRDGKDGGGSDGTNAVVYSLEPTSDAIHTNAAGTATANWGAVLYRSEGTNRAPYESTVWVVKFVYEKTSVDEQYNGSSITIDKSDLSFIKSLQVKTYDGAVSPDRLLISRTYFPVADGAQGIQGVVVRQMGEWNKDTKYVNQSELETNDIRYLDIVQYRDRDGHLCYFECKPTGAGEYNQGHEPLVDNDYTNWWTEADMFNFIATQLLLAQNATIDFLSGNAIYLHKKNGDVTIGLQGEAGDIGQEQNPMIFAGAKSEVAARAPFRVYADGSMFASMATIEGEVIATSGKLDNVFVGQNGIWIGKPDGKHIILRTDGDTPEIKMLDGTRNLMEISCGSNGVASITMGGNKVRINDSVISLNNDAIQIQSLNATDNEIQIGGFKIECSGGKVYMSGAEFPTTGNRFGDVYVDDSGYLRVKTW